MISIRSLTQKRYKGLFKQNFFAFGVIHKFKLPDLGEKIKEATLKKWHVKVGDTVQEFDEIADVATDKLFTAIPSPFNGKIHKIFHKEEDICQVGELLVEFDVEQVEDGKKDIMQEIQKETQNQQNTIESSNQNKSDASNSKLTFMLPSVRQYAFEKKVNLDEIKGTGPGGRIQKQDIDNYLTNSKTKSDNIQQPQGQTQNQSSQKQAQQTQNKKQIEADSKKTIKMTPFQQGMSKSMTESNRIPTLYLKDEIDVTQLDVMREKFKKQGIKLTLMSLFIKAFSAAISKYPIINSTYDDSKPFEFTQIDNHNISIAIDSPQGLVVPHIKNVQNKSILDVQNSLIDLIDKSKKGILGPQELFGGSICISNVGTIGGTYTGPLILPPQVCIVGIGKQQILPRYVDGKLEPRKTIYVSFGVDHRVVDGATTARFCNQWKNYLENPEQLLVELK